MFLSKKWSYMLIAETFSGALIPSVVKPSTYCQNGHKREISHRDVQVYL